MSAMPSGHGDAPATLPMAPTVLEYSVDHEDTVDGPVTLIVRSVDRPGLCQMCPRSMCNHGRTYCFVRVKGYVPDRLCPGYTIGGPG